MLDLKFANRKSHTDLTHLFPVHPFSTPENIRKPYGEKIDWEQRINVNPFRTSVPSDFNAFH